MKRKGLNEMIRVVVEDYCHDCLDFTPDVIKPERVRTEGGQLVYTDTFIQCKNHKRCAAIKRYLEQKVKEEVSG